MHSHTKGCTKTPVVLEAADFQAVLAAVQQNGWLLKHASVDMKNNEEVVLAAVKQDSWALQFASDQMKNNPRVVLMAVQNKGPALNSQAIR